jgi:hypothetical protein
MWNKKSAASWGINGQLANILPSFLSAFTTITESTDCFLKQASMLS